MTHSKNLHKLQHLIPEFVRNPPALYDPWEGRALSKQLAFWGGFSLIVNVFSDLILLSAVPLIGWPIFLLSIAVFLFCSIALLNFIYSNLCGRYEIAKRLARSLNLRGNENILIFDVHDGVFAAAFAEKIETTKIWGLGQWRESRVGREQLLKLMQRLQAKKVHQKVALDSSSLYQAPFKNDSFDIVFFMETETNRIPRHYLDDFLTEMLRVLKPQGEFIIFTAFQFQAMRHGLKKLGIKKCRCSKRLYNLFPLYRLLRGKKP